MNDRVARVRGVRRAVLAAGVGLWAAGPVPAQSPQEGFDRARAMTAVADQKADAWAKEIFGEADRVAPASPAEAAKRLKRALVSLDTSASISEAKRRDLAALFQTRISALEGRPVTPANDPKAVALTAEQKRQQDALLRETKDVRDALAEVEKWQAANNPAAARAVVSAVAQKYPNNPVVVALTGQGNLGDAVADAKQMASEQAKRTVYALNQVQESALPAVRDVTFPADWAKRVKPRDDEGIKLSPEDEAILQSLEKRIGAGVKDTPFLETVQALSNLIGKEVYLDRKSLDDAGLDLQRPVTMPGNVSARTALRAILQSQGLTFVVKDRLIQVVTLEKAQSLQVTRAYYLGELLTGAGPYPGGAPAWGPLLDYQQTMANARVVMDSIVQSVDPLIWKDKGGPATITFHPPTMSIVVRAPTEVHASFKGKLSGR